MEGALLKSLLRVFTLAIALLLSGAGAGANAKVAGKASAGDLPICEPELVTHRPFYERWWNSGDMFRRPFVHRPRSD